MPFDGAWAYKQLAGDLWIGQAVSGQDGDLSLLRGKSVAILRIGPSHLRTGCQQFPPAALSEARHPHRREHLVRRGQFATPVDLAALLSEPFAVEQTGPRGLG